MVLEGVAYDAVAYNDNMPEGHSPQHIVCLQPSATVILASAGALDRVAACTRHCADVVPELARTPRRPVAKDTSRWACDRLRKFIVADQRAANWFRIEL